jgi:ring-1,2-phenylacetyl-CoA epoxidase subunit PaaC
MNENISSGGSYNIPFTEGSREAYILHLADNALILGQRNAEWCGHGPVLEQDIAITNISLDLIGQSRNFYQFAAELINLLRQKASPKYQSDSDHTIHVEVTEDTLAYFRTEREFRNCLLVELPNGDWAQTILRQFLVSAYQFLLYGELQKKESGSREEQVSAIAAKALKEVTYHLRWSSEWVIRLGDGTEESHARMQRAVDELWPYTGEFFIAAEFEKEAVKTGFGIDPTIIKARWEENVASVFSEAAIDYPSGKWMQTGGKHGMHTEHLGYILAEMQYLQRSYPGSEW